VSDALTQFIVATELADHARRPDVIETEALTMMVGQLDAEAELTEPEAEQPAQLPARAKRAPKSAAV
jgi:hypothetical protein